MTTTTTNQSLQAQEKLPDVVVLRSGSRFKPLGDHWMLMDGVTRVSFNFHLLPPEVTPLLFSLKRTLINFLQNNSPRYAKNMFDRFCDLAGILAEGRAPVSQIDALHLINFAARVNSDDHLGRESQVSAVLSRWHSLGLPGISDAAVSFLRSRKKKGNRKGVAVLTLDPVRGPFTELELQGLLSAVTQAFADNRITEQHFMLTWLVALTGQRSVQYCALKAKDVVVTHAHGQTQYEINIPTAKQRDEVHRESFLRRPLPYQFGQALWRFARSVQASLLNLGDEAPLFPSTSDLAIARQLNPAFRQHADPVELGESLTRSLQRVAPLSERTKEPLHIAIGRFRNTIGTRAAQEGHGELVIAEILGHADTQNVKCYVSIIPEIAERLDKQLAKALAPLVHAFTGEVLADKSKATRADDPSSLIVDYANTFEPVGNCGTKLDCHFHAPIACYTCHNFQAWADAPHEALLEELLAERERLMHTAGPRIAAINDRTIIAIQAVVDTCAC